MWFGWAHRARSVTAEPPITGGDPALLVTEYLDFYRATVLHKADGLTEERLRTSVVPSGWTPLALLNHLAHVERRWFRWGFAAERVTDPWGDVDEDDRWWVGPDRSTADVLADLARQQARARDIAAAAAPSDVAAVGGRFSPGEEPTLAWICFHVLSEYARHAGHLDIARELADGAVGE